MKKIFASAVAAALALSMAVPAFAADTGTLSVTADKTEVEAGGEVTVTIDLTGVAELVKLEGVDGHGGLGVGNFTVVYDSEQLEPVGKPHPFDPETLNYFTMSSPANTMFTPMSTIVDDGMSIQFFTTMLGGAKVDLELGTITFTVSEDVQPGTEIEIGLALPSDGNAFATTGGTEADGEIASIPNDEIALVPVTVTVPDDEPITEEPVTEEPVTEEPTTEEPTTEEPTTSGAGTTTGGAGTTTSGSGTVKPGSDNNKTGDAGVLAIGGLMVLAAGATMLTLKKKSK